MKMRRRTIAIALSTAVLVMVMLILVFWPKRVEPISGTWYTVDRGDVTRTMVASGTMVPSGEVEAADVTHVAVTLHSSGPHVSAGAIQWVIDNGKMVKKGDLLVELDDSEWRRQLTEQPMAPARRKFVEEQIANCRMLAPRDGLAVYYEETHRRPGGPGGPWVAAGELVKEGQRLLAIYELSKMLVKTHICQSRIVRVRLGQPARIHVDRFPGRAFRGQVSHIEARAVLLSDHPMEGLWPGMKRAVWVTLSDPVEGLWPGMNAEVSIELGRSENVLRVPTSSLMLSENQAICFVRSGWGLETRVVGVELGDSQFVGIIDGLKEGEQVLRDATRQQTARQHEEEAETARRFLGHPLRRVREWAAAEIESAKRQARHWRQRDEKTAAP